MCVCLCVTGHVCGPHYPHTGNQNTSQPKPLCASPLCFPLPPPCPSLMLCIIRCVAPHYLTDRAKVSAGDSAYGPTGCRPGVNTHSCAPPRQVPALCQVRLMLGALVLRKGFCDCSGVSAGFQEGSTCWLGARWGRQQVGVAGVGAGGHVLHSRGQDGKPSSKKASKTRPTRLAARRMVLLLQLL